MIFGISLYYLRAARNKKHEKCLWIMESIFPEAKISQMKNANWLHTASKKAHEIIIFKNNLLKKKSCAEISL